MPAHRASRGRAQDNQRRVSQLQDLRHAVEPHLGRLPVGTIHDWAKRTLEGYCQHFRSPRSGFEPEWIGQADSEDLGGVGNLSIPSCRSVAAVAGSSITSDELACVCALADEADCSALGNY